MPAMPANFSNQFQVIGDTGGFIRLLFHDQIQQGAPVAEVGHTLLKLTDAETMALQIIEMAKKIREMQVQETAQNSTKQ